MKTYLFTAALFLGSAAVAQAGGQSGSSQPGSTEAGTGQPDTTQPDMPATGSSAGAQPGGEGTDQMGQTGQQPDAGTPPGGQTSGMTDMNATGASSGMGGPATSAYPPCSRTVQDRCIETSRRSRRR